MLRLSPHEQCANRLWRETGWAEAGARDEKIFRFTVSHRLYRPGFAVKVPYAEVGAKLEEGAKIVSNPIVLKPHGIRCGVPPVEVALDNLAEEVLLPKFRLAAGV